MLKKTAAHWPHLCTEVACLYYVMEHHKWTQDGHVPFCKNPAVPKLIFVCPDLRLVHNDKSVFCAILM
jgi:hypothetical protein